MALDNLRGGTKRVVKENTPLNNLRGGTKRVVIVDGGGGGDQHNLGYYATQAALEEAHPTAEAGDWAIVGATDTVWIWDTDNSEWVDSDQKGQVTSVNGQTGDVVLDLLPSQTGNAGKFLTTDGTDASWSDKPLVNQATGSYSIGIGSNTISNNNSVVIGNSSNISGAFSQYGVVVGNGAQASGYSTAVGSFAQAVGSQCIQLGKGTNNNANTFKVANVNGNFELMNANGNLPADRLASTTGLADGNYKLRLTMASGVPTLSWVAE